MHWTISRLKDYETCPKRYEFKYVLNVGEPGPKAPALLRGTIIHESIEHYLLGRDELHSEIKPHWREQLKWLRANNATPEQQWEFEAGWHPYTHSDEPLWLRMKLDANYREPRRRDRLPTHKVIDFKTGRHYPSNVEQNEVYALGTFAMFDDVDVVNTALWYLDEQEPYEKTYTRDQASKLARKWEGRSARMLEAESYPAQPGVHCRWCPFKSICPQAA